MMRGVNVLFAIFVPALRVACVAAGQARTSGARSRGLPLIGPARGPPSMTGSGNGH